MNVRRTIAPLLAALLALGLLAGCGKKSAPASASNTAAPGGENPFGAPSEGDLSAAPPAAAPAAAPSATPKTSADMNETRDQLAPLAVKIAQEGYGVSLDYSRESIRSVEQVLGALYDQYQQEGRPDNLQGVALEFGAYIVQVMDRNDGPGKWLKDSPEMGPNTMPYYWRDRVIFPVTWCEKRLTMGPSEDVWAKYQQVVLSQVR